MTGTEKFLTPSFPLDNAAEVGTDGGEGDQPTIHFFQQYGGRAVVFEEFCITYGEVLERNGDFAFTVTAGFRYQVITKNRVESRSNAGKGKGDYPAKTDTDKFSFADVQCKIPDQYNYQLFFSFFTRIQFCFFGNGLFSH